MNCIICLDTYTDPRLLPCFHVFCLKCIKRLPTHSSDGQPSLTCPECRQETPVPPNGVAGLRPAFHINRLLRLLDELKTTKDSQASAERVDSKAESSETGGCASPHNPTSLETARSFSNSDDGTEESLLGTETALMREESEGQYLVFVIGWMS